MFGLSLKDKFITYFRAQVQYGLAFQDISVPKDLKAIALRGTRDAKFQNELWKRIDSKRINKEDRDRIDFDCQVISKVQEQFGSLNKGDLAVLLVAAEKLQEKALSFKVALQENKIW